MRPSKIRVLVTDDSAVVRRMLTEAIASDPEIEVVGTARHGEEAVQLFKLHWPDVMVLDVEMPVMDGVETVTAVRAIDPQQPIIMFSSITTRGGQATLDALAAGANDYVTKPTGMGHAGDAWNYIRDELIPKIKLWGRIQRLRNGLSFVPASAGAEPVNARLQTPPSSTPARVGSPPAVLAHRPAAASLPIDIVAIGVSTGGPNTLADVLARLPGDFPVPIVIVQHMPAIFTRLLAERLDTVCPLHVREAIDGAVLQSGDVWVAPGNYHMSIVQQQAQRVLKITQEAHENSCRPSVDPLFRSVATVYASHAMGVVLTGMGRDGEAGSRAIHQAGGRVIVQDETSSVVWGMPRAVAQAGLADAVLDLPQIAQAMIDGARRTSVRNPVKQAAAR
jgi:two-component system chemotaxis response regulator CheB